MISIFLRRILRNKGPLTSLREISKAIFYKIYSFCIFLILLYTNSLWDTLLKSLTPLAIVAFLKMSSHLSFLEIRFRIEAFSNFSMFLETLIFFGTIFSSYSFCPFFKTSMVSTVLSTLRFSNIVWAIHLCLLSKVCRLYLMICKRTPFIVMVSIICPKISWS